MKQVGNLFLFKLIRSMVGNESQLVPTLKKDNSSSLFYKILGKHDILEISELKQLKDAARLNSNAHILDINYFPCLCLHQRPEIFVDHLKGAIAPTLTFLKLQEPIFRTKGFHGIDKIISFLKGNNELFLLHGMGYYEILLFKFTDGFESIFDFLDEIRKVKIRNVFPSFSKRDLDKGVFSSTITLPLISYKSVIFEKNWSKLKGTVKPIVTLRCAPGCEAHISQGYTISQWDNLLGIDDLIYNNMEPINLSTFIEKLYGFRESAADSFTVFNTTTKLYSSRKLLDTSDTLDLPKIERPAFWLFETIRSIEAESKLNQFIISELINIVSLINTHIGNRVIKFTYSDILFATRYYFNWLIDEYKKAGVTNSIPKKSMVEDMLLCYASSVRAAISQHFPTEDLGDASNLGSSRSFECYLTTIIKAISVIPEQLFSIIKKSKQPQKLIDNQNTNVILVESSDYYEKPWNGFLFLSLSENYQVLDQSEIICVPHRDIFNVTNWITLSHEISHAYFIRIFFTMLEDEYLKQKLPFRTDCSDESTIDHYAQRKKLYWEFFAHWFDYKHFFNGDLDFYLWSIWKTLLDVPRTYQHRIEYWVRSLFIQICNSWDDFKLLLDKVYNDTHFKSQKVRAAAYREIFNDPLNKLINYLKSIMSSEEYKNIEIDESQREIIKEMMTMYFDFCRLLEENYVNRDIIDEVEKTYPKLNAHMDQILRGKIVKDKIANPFLLLREIRRKIYMKEIKVIDDKSTIAFLFSFWETSRHFRRPLMIPLWK